MDRNDGLQRLDGTLTLTGTWTEITVDDPGDEYTVEFPENNDYSIQWIGRRPANLVEAFTMATAVALKRSRQSCARIPGRTRSRESHRTRRGHARRASRRTTSSRGSDDSGSSSEPPRLSLAEPRAILTFGVRAREVWGLE